MNNKQEMNKENKIVVFGDKKIRRAWYKDEWWFSVVDIVEVLTDSAKPRDYWYRMKKRESDESGVQLSTDCRQLKLESQDGKKYATDCANTEIMFRIIQSIPSKKAEPFKKWLAKVGYERVQEIENPELAQERMKQIYEQKGYSKDWIDKRLRGIAIRQNLTDEWKERGLTKSQDYAILTAEISKATFGMTPSEYKDHKGLTKKNENLRDHMTDLELIFNMLGEKATTEISSQEKPKGFEANRKVAKRGGNVGKTAREALEKETKKSVISDENYLDSSENQIKKFSNEAKNEI